MMGKGKKGETGLRKRRFNIGHFCSRENWFTHLGHKVPASNVTRFSHNATRKLICSSVVSSGINSQMNRALFNGVSKVIRDCIGFALLLSVIGLENSRHPLNQLDAKLKPIATWLLSFSRASGHLHVFTLSSHWLLVMLIFVLIGRCDYFGFGFTTLNRKAL